MDPPVIRKITVDGQFADEVLDILENEEQIDRAIRMPSYGTVAETLRDRGIN